MCHVTTRLKRLHEAGLAHRDLKPGNVLWRPQHLEWTLIDFGCAAAIGVPFFPSPWIIVVDGIEHCSLRDTPHFPIYPDAQGSQALLVVLASPLLGRL